MFEVVRAVFSNDLRDVLDLYNEYVNSTLVDLSFQGNDQEFRFFADWRENEVLLGEGGIEKRR
ncbi:hypothetical protein [Halomonas sp. Y3]|uniref:hypothetical protein n=1 Tax=Halomonas sp. Y3 TaxID=2956797 RepID=UPI00209E3E3B|nr:hypothetical protein [Halomonas sp. Y3]